MKIAELAQYIRDTAQVPIYANDFPIKAKDNCGFVRLDGGGSPSIYIPELKSSGFQVMIRHVDSEKAESIANAVWILFHAKTHYDIGEEHIYVSMCTQSEPIFIGDDSNGRALYSINVTCRNRPRSN